MYVTTHRADFICDTCNFSPVICFHARKNGGFLALGPIFSQNSIIFSFFKITSRSRMLFPNALRRLVGKFLYPLFKFILTKPFFCVFRQHNPLRLKCKLDIFALFGNSTDFTPQNTNFSVFSKWLLEAAVWYLIPYNSLFDSLLSLV